LLAVASVVWGLWGLEAGAGRPTSGVRADRQKVDLFAGIEKGQLDVKIFPRDSRELSIVLPDAFAAVPVVAQFQDPGVQHRGGKEHQPVGTAPPMGQNVGGPMFNNMANPGGGAFFFNVEPEKVAQLKLRTVCLEFGLAEPNPRIPYAVKPLAAVTSKPGVREVCRQLSTEVDQKVVQAAAWHLNNGLSWEQLKAKRSKSDFGLAEPLFTSRELKQGRRLAETALERSKPARIVASSTGGL
jgi:hypothetical protein